MAFMSISVGHVPAHHTCIFHVFRDYLHHGFEDDWTHITTHLKPACNCSDTLKHNYGVSQPLRCTGITQLPQLCSIHVSLRDTNFVYTYTNSTAASFILLGILVSYLTQHYRIIARRSSEGISPYFVLLGTTGGTCALSNILVLPASRADLACCKEISEFACFAGLLGILQVALQWSCFAIMYVAPAVLDRSGIP